MSLDRQAIEKRDFPISRRGYETLAVDAHLAQVAREVEALQAERTAAVAPVPVTSTPSLASSASDQVRAIVQAAERSAAEIEQQAADDAARRRADATTAAEAARAAAEAEAQQHVAAAQGEAGAMLERIRAVESLLEHLRATAEEVQAGLDALHAQVGTLAPTSGEGAAAAAPAIPASPQPAVPATPAPPATPVVRATPAPPENPAPPGVAPAGARSDDEAGARMVALSLVLDGVPRDQIERHLDEHYALDDRAALLDDLYARQP